MVPLHSETTRKRRPWLDWEHCSPGTDREPLVSSQHQWTPVGEGHTRLTLYHKCAADKGKKARLVTPESRALLLQALLPFASLTPFQKDGNLLLETVPKLGQLDSERVPLVGQLLEQLLHRLQELEQAEEVLGVCCEPAGRHTGGKVSGMIDLLLKRA